MIQQNHNMLQKIKGQLEGIAMEESNQEERNIYWKFVPHVGAYMGEL